MLVGGKCSDGRNRRSTHGCFNSPTLTVQLHLLQREHGILACAHRLPIGVSFPGKLGFCGHIFLTSFVTAASVPGPASMSQCEPLTFGSRVV